MQNTPTPIYLLLTNPAWGNTPVFDHVLEGAAKGWDFDPNETHDDAPLLGATVHRWKVLGLPESGLLQVVNILVKRGADPCAALEHASSQGAGWIGYGAVKNMLVSLSSGKDLDSASLGASLVDIASQGLNIQDANTEINKLLEPLGGWSARIDGVGVLSWLALNCCEEGDMQGWTTTRWSGADSNVRKMRLLRSLALSSKTAETANPTDQLLTACGMLLLSSYYRKTGGEVDAGNALCKVAGKILGTDEAAIVQNLSRVIKDDDLDPSLRARLGMSVALGLVPAIQDPTLSWEAFALAIPLMYGEGKFLGCRQTLSKVLNLKKGLPGISFWDALPHDSIHHEAMLRVMLCSYNASMFGNPLISLRHDLLDDLKRWASLGALPEFDMEACKSWVQNQAFHHDDELQQELEQYQGFVRASFQSLALSQTTPVSSPPSPRARF